MYKTLILLKLTKFKTQKQTTMKHKFPLFASLISDPEILVLFIDETSGVYLKNPGNEGEIGYKQNRFVSINEPGEWQIVDITTTPAKNEITDGCIVKNIETGAVFLYGQTKLIALNEIKKIGIKKGFIYSDVLSNMENPSKYEILEEFTIKS